MTIKFTPKPWKIITFERPRARPYKIKASEGVTKPYRDTHSRSGYNFSVHIWSLGGKVAKVFNRHGRVTREKMLANARLISVAPNMYGLLDQALQEEMSSNLVFADTLRDIAKILAYVDGTGPKP